MRNLLLNGEHRTGCLADVVRAHLDRIEEVTLMCAITVFSESPLKAAEQADSASEEDRMRPFHGVYWIKGNRLVGTPL